MGPTTQIELEMVNHVLLTEWMNLVYLDIENYCQINKKLVNKIGLKNMNLE